MTRQIHPHGPEPPVVILEILMFVLTIFDDVQFVVGAQDVRQTLSASGEAPIQPHPGTK